MPFPVLLPSLASTLVAVKLKKLLPYLAAFQAHAMGQFFIGFGALVSTLLGYDLGVLSGAIPHLEAYSKLTKEELELGL